MKDEEIENIIDSVNDGSSIDYVFSHPLKDNVSFAKVWSHEAEQRIREFTGYNFYLIRDDNRQCIGAIFEMGEFDLHGWMKESFRRKGLMSKALREIVLPHIFSNGRREQKITFRSGDVPALALIKKVGFDILEETKAMISAGAVPRVEFDPIVHTGIDADRAKLLETKLLHAACALRMVRDELEIKLGDELSEDLGETAWRVHNRGDGMIDYWRRFETDRTINPDFKGR